MHTHTIPASFSQKSLDFSSSNKGGAFFSQDLSTKTFDKTEIQASISASGGGKEKRAIGLSKQAKESIAGGWNEDKGSSVREDFGAWEVGGEKRSRGMRGIEEERR